MFQSTLPAGEPELMRLSAFQRYLDDTVQGELGARLSSLNPSLLLDLQRFERREREGDALELLEVIAAGLRHRRSLLVHLQIDNRVLPLTLFPVEGIVHCPLAPGQFLAEHLAELRVLHVEPAHLPVPGSVAARAVTESDMCSPLGPVSWELALRGSRAALLPEIAGNAAYRIVPDARLDTQPLTGSLAAAVQRLRGESTNLREIAQWEGFDAERATRLLNALYLQAALIISRTHPAATNEGWFSGR